GIRNSGCIRRASSAAQWARVRKTHRKHCAGRSVVRAYVRAPWLGVRRRDLFARTACRLVSPRRGAVGLMTTTQTKILGLSTPRWCRIDVDETAWNNALANLES